MYREEASRWLRIPLGGGPESGRGEGGVCLSPPSVIQTHTLGTIGEANCLTVLGARYFSSCQHHP